MIGNQYLTSVRAALYQTVEQWSITQIIPSLHPSNTIHILCPALSTSWTALSLVLYHQLWIQFLVSLCSLFISCLTVIPWSLHTVSLYFCSGSAGGFSKHKASCEIRGVVSKNFSHDYFCYHGNFFPCRQHLTAVCALFMTDENITRAIIKLETEMFWGLL